MYHGIVIFAIVAAAMLALCFSMLSFSFRDFSRTRLQHYLKRHRRLDRYNWLLEHTQDLAFITALFRLLANITILICVLALFHESDWNIWLRYVYAFCIAGLISAFASIAIPLAIARHAGAIVIGVCASFLMALHVIMLPAIAVMRFLDRLAGRAAGPRTEEQEQEALEEQILSAVEEGEKEGIVDEQEREMIESVIEFRDATAREVMTARPDIVALDTDTGLTVVRDIFERTGHSRIPVYDGTLDHIIGVLYARDLLKYVGESAPVFDIRAAVRQAVFVPETKPLRDLLRDFRLLKIHMAIVLDEYGGTAGLVTIEDVLEQLVGEISDEHEPQEPALYKKIDERTWEIDARMEIAELNATLQLSLPEDQEIHTIGGYIATSIGRIPEKGAVLNQPGRRFTVIDAEPQRINRVRLELVPG